MNIYKINFESDDYKYLMLDRQVYKSDEEFEKASLVMNFDGTSKTEGWKPPKMHSLYPKRKEADFWMLNMNAGAFAVREEALDTVYMFLEMAGELLPLPYEDQTLTICNITECIDCLDAKRSEWKTLKPSGKRISVEKPVFVPGNVTDSTLFKIPEMPLAIFCWEEHRDAESEFKACVEENDLTGLKFELVWSEEEEDEDAENEEEEDDSGED